MQLMNATCRHGGSCKATLGRAQPRRARTMLHRSSMLFAMFPVFVAVPIFAGGISTPVFAQEKQEKKSSAQKSYEAGVKAYNAGKTKEAVDKLSSALRIGGLGTTDLAKAMYLRGLSYQKQKKPGLAISDLTSAVWIKNGLSEAERQNALAMRQQAYAEAGISSSEVVAAPAVSQGPPPTPTAAAAPTAPAPSSPADENLVLNDPSASTAVTRQAPDSPSAQDAARARQNATAPVGGLAAAVSGRYDSTPPPALAPAPTTVAAAPSSSSGSSGGLANAPQAIGNFFSNLFSGGSSSSSTDDSISTGFAPGGAAPPSSTIVAGPSGTSSGSAGDAIPPFTTAAIPANEATPLPTKTAAAPTARVARPSPSPAPTAVATPPAKKVYKGRYKLHIAALRSRDEAQAIADKLAAAHGGDLENRAPSVDAAVIGSMGTFYRVRVGGYASASRPKAICDKLRTSGFDCLVVPN